MEKPHLGVMFKPVSADCNMCCDYCYYRSVEDLYGRPRAPRMGVEVVEAVCDQYLALKPCELKFGWQGGEPTLMGLPFFRHIVQVQQERCGGGPAANTLQTNGVLLDEDWCRFLKAHGFLVGLSVDGPPRLNAFRRFRNGRPTHDRAMRALALLKEHEVDFNVLIVISRANAEHARGVFRFLTDNELRFAQLIPCTEPSADGRGLSEHSITTEQYADFVLSFFAAWVENDDPGYYVRRIDNWLHVFFGLEPEMCEYRGDCSNLLTIEYNGDVYPCDFFVEERYCLGNVLRQTLEQMLGGRTFRRFVDATRQNSSVCAGCEWLAVCDGGCYRHRGKLGIAPDERPYLCEANKKVFARVFGTFRELLSRDEKPRLHRFLQSIERQLGRQRPHKSGTAPEPEPWSRGAVGRNDLCPCGSGKKFKNCCLRHAPAGRSSRIAACARREAQ